MNECQRTKALRYATQLRTLFSSGARLRNFSGNGSRRSRLYRTPSDMIARSVAVPIPEHVIPGDCVSERGAQENVRREMSQIRNAGKTDHSRHAVSYPGDPFVRCITASYDRADGECRCGMTRRETASFAQKAELALEKSVPKIVTGRHSRRPETAANHLYDYVRNRAVEISLTRQNGCLLRIRIVAQQTGKVYRGGNTRFDNAGIRRTENFGGLVKSRIVADMGFYVRVRCNEPARDANDGKRRDPMSATGQLRRKEPEFFLILQDPHREMLPRDVRIDGRAGSVGVCLRVAGIRLRKAWIRAWYA